MGSLMFSSHACTAAANLRERGRPIDKHPAVGLRDPLRDGLSNLGQLRLPSLFPLLEKPQPLAEDLTLE